MPVVRQVITKTTTAGHAAIAVPAWYQIANRLPVQSRLGVVGRRLVILLEAIEQDIKCYARHNDQKSNALTV